MKITSRTTGGLALAVLLAFALAGCAADSDPTGDATPTASQSVDAPTDAPTDTPQTPDATPAADDSDAQGAKLDKMIEATQPLIPDLVASFNGLYSDIAIEGEHPGTVVYTYVYAEQLDAKETAEGLDGMIPTLQSIVDSQVFPGMTQQGVTDQQQVIYAYVNADGAEIWSHTFTPGS
jgi:hypothetical protein